MLNSKYNMIDSALRKYRQSVLRIVSLLLAAFLCIIPAMPVLAYDIPEATASFYTNDTAELITKENEDYIIGTCEDLYSKTGAQVVVVTIQSLEGTSIEEYSTELFRQYGIGDKEKNNGILILLSLEDRECRIEVGYGLEGAINDAKAGRIMDQYMIPYFRENNWNEGMINGFDAIMDEICNEYGVEVEHNTPIVPSGTGESSSGDDWMWTCILAGIIGLLGGVFMGKVCPGQAMIPGSIYLIIDLIFIMNTFPKGSKFLASFATLVAYVLGWGLASPDIDGYGGSSGGYSSSSRSYGGGSSYNSGGGGRSGGGGASRKF